ncbi:hypothetical protein BELINDA_197 [Bacillus phage Belinda]|uniref:hypothetical protein n=1 Tax=Bacillus phage Belinda TaxID=1852564 RepID=UPI0007F0822F|nr:hypothetical protein BI039_gp181 [Bacillus phage Belinda]ANM46123.1 hypothetical protein BELINDA_197 [Bacillus phage Belinda]
MTGVIENAMPHLSGKYLRYTKQGAISVGGEPHYIVDLIKEHDGTMYAIVFKAHTPHPKGVTPKKKASSKSERMNPFSLNTTLGAWANSKMPPKYRKKWVIDDPLFVCPIVNGVSTLSGRRGQGFYEREPDVLKPRGGEMVMVRGDYTGVFIHLNDVHWFNEFSVGVKNIVQALSMQQGEFISDFYDLEHSNESVSNPLSRYYEVLDKGLEEIDDQRRV